MLMSRIGGFYQRQPSTACFFRRKPSCLRTSPDRLYPKVRHSRVSHAKLPLFPAISDLGGDLPPLSTVENPLRRYCNTVPPTPPELQIRSAASIPDHDHTPVSSMRRRKDLSATSLLNPYYGYPVAYNTSTVPTLRHGRRRKRDLARTLLRLWWSRWRHSVKVVMFILVLLLAFMFSRRPIWQRRWRLAVPILELLATVPVPFS